MKSLLRTALLAGMAGLAAVSASTHGQTEPSRHYIFSVDEDRLSGLPDQSALNRPIDASSRLQARDAHFYRAGPDLRPGTQDDERIRLFGINLSFDANFPSTEFAPILAKRLRRLGINIVRLHHLDSSPGTATDPPASLLLPEPYPSFNPIAVSRLKAFIEALSQEGIYVDLNLRVGYPFSIRDGIPDFDRARMARPNASPIAVYHPTLVALQERYAREAIAQLGLRGNPALALVEISNEASLLAAWQRREWPDAVPGEYRETLRGLWQAWLNERYGSPTAACRAWGKCLTSDQRPDLPSPLDAAPTRRWLEKASTRLPAPLGRLVSGGDPAGAPDGREPRRVRDFLAFLADTDRAYFDRLRRAVQDAAGFPVATTGTQAGYGGILNLHAQEDMDYIDEHTYVSHPDFLNGFSDPRNWRIWNDSLTNKDMDAKLLTLAFVRDVRKPFVLSEFNHPFPGLQSAEMIPITAMVAALQDWDGIFFFDYADGATWSTAPSGFSLRGDWGKYVLASQSAWLYRTAQLPPLNRRLNIPMRLSTMLALSAEPAGNPLEQHLERRYGIKPALAWTHAIAIDIRPDAPPPAARAVPSPPYATPDGSVRFDPNQQVLTLRTPLAMGWFGRIGIAGGDDGLAVAPLASSSGTASILLTSGDGHPIRTSSRLLLALGSQTVGTQPGSSPPRPKAMVPHPGGKGAVTLEPDPLHAGSPSGSRYAEPPAWLAASPVTVGWNTASSGRFTIYPLDGAGRRMAALPDNRVRRQSGRISVDLQVAPAESSPWYEVVADGK